MKRQSMLKVVAGMGILAFVWTGTARAEEKFGALAGVPAEKISASEMTQVEGKFGVNPLPIISGVLRLVGTLPIPSVPTVPGVPGLPTTPGVPSIPSIPSIPSLPGFSASGSGSGSFQVLGSFFSGSGSGSFGF